MFKNFKLTFSEKVTLFVKQEYQQASNILEYGSGGSTILAASKGKTVVSTESSAPWLIELMGSYKERKLPGDIIPIFCDIGETKAWGHPKDETRWKSWPAYPINAWKYCLDNKINPDLVLIDGRFRVACFIASCINTTTPMRILFDDFVERPHYHIVKSIVEPSQIIDNHLAVFDIKPGMVSSKFLLDNLHFFHNPD